MARGNKSIPIEERRDLYETLALDYWERWFKYKDNTWGKAFADRMKGQAKLMKNAARGDVLEENNLSLSEMRIIDDRIKKSIRIQYDKEQGKD